MLIRLKEYKYLMREQETSWAELCQAQEKLGLATPALSIKKQIDVVYHLPTI
jgi:hypothetical protein